MKKIDDFFNKHDDLVMFIGFIIIIFIVRKDLMKLGCAVGFCFGYFYGKYADKILDFIDSKVFKK